MSEKIYDPVGIPPLVVVPCNYLESGLFPLEIVLDGRDGIVDGRASLMNQIGGNDLFVGIFQYPLQIRLRGLLHQCVDLLDGARPRGLKRKIDD